LRKLDENQGFGKWLACLSEKKSPLIRL